MTTMPIRRSRVRRLLPAALLPTAAVAALVLTAPAAYALTEQQIKSECEAANGGTYSTYVAKDGTRISNCCYKDIGGHQHCDVYQNGNYVSTTDQQSVNPPPVAQPGLPPAGTVAPGAPVMPGQGSQPVQPPPATATPVIP